MTIIKINGGFWGWEPIETLERLYPLFEQYTLDRSMSVREFCKSEAGVAAVRRASGLSGLHGNFGAVSALWEPFLYRHR